MEPRSTSATQTCETISLLEKGVACGTSREASCEFLTRSSKKMSLQVTLLMTAAVESSTTVAISMSWIPWSQQTSQMVRPEAVAASFRRMVTSSSNPARSPKTWPIEPAVESKSSMATSHSSIRCSVVRRLPLETSLARQVSASPGNGGGLHITGTNGTQTLIDNTIVNNNVAANEGGGLWNQNGSQMTVMNGSGDNLAGLGGGGGILNRGKMTIMESSIIRNQTMGDGGGIKTTAGSVSQMSSSEVSRNTSDGNGGGISNAGLFFTGTSSITYNQADLAGGGIFTANMGQSKTVGTNFFGNSDLNNP